MSDYQIKLTPELAQVASDAFDVAYAQAEDPATAMSYALGATLAAAAPLIATAAYRAGQEQAAHDIEKRIDDHAAREYSGAFDMATQERVMHIAARIARDYGAEVDGG